MVLSSIVVQNLDDAGAGSLRDAITQANLDPALDAISFAPGLSGAIALDSALPDLATNMAITGPGESALILEYTLAFASVSKETPILSVPAGPTVSIDGLTLKGGSGLRNAGTLGLSNSTVSGNPDQVMVGGYGAGGGIKNFGTLALVNVTVSGNGFLFAVDGARAGGIYNASMLTIVDSRITNNGAESEGGGIYNSGTLQLKNSTVSDNGVGFTSLGNGGGIYNTGDFTILNSTINGNHAGTSLASGNGGGIYNTGNLSISNSTISGNEEKSVLSASGLGGGIYNTGTTAISNTVIDGNSVLGWGGGIANSGLMSIVSSSVSGNSAWGGGNGYGGGIYNDGEMGLSNTTVGGNLVKGGKGAYFGGGIYNKGLFALDQSLVRDNLAARDTGSNGGFGGGIDNEGTMRIVNTTITGNGADNEGDGIENMGDLMLSDSTVSDNRLPGAGRAEGLMASANPGSVATAINSIFNNPGGFGVASGGSWAFQSLGHNLFSDQPYFAVDSTDLINTNPMLGPLADNGGPTQTMALLPGSPAIGAGIALAGVTTDQRGVIRLSYRQPDIGAYEAQLPPVVLGVRRFGVHREPTSLAVVFSQPMDAARAGNLNAYRLTTMGGRVVPIASASYDPVSFTTTLRLSRLLPLRGSFRLTVMGTPPNGLTDAQGLFLDGAGNRQPGSDYVARINSWNLTPPIHRAPPRWARRV